MNARTFKTTAALFAILLTLVAPAALAQKVDIQGQINDVKNQQKEADTSDKAAKDPNNQSTGDAKTKADAEDKAQQHVDDVKDNPSGFPKGELEKAQKEATAASQAADKAAKDVKNGQGYRDKLKQRRSKKKLLKAALQHLKDAIKHATADGKTISPEQMTEANNVMQAAEAALGALGPLSMALPAETGTALALLVSQGKVKLTTSGTGETIGHIADCKIQNLTDQPLSCAITPMILESGSGKNQHYACPQGQSVALQPDETKTVPLNGVCLNRNKPPVGKGVTGDLVVNDGKPLAGQDGGGHLPANDVSRLLTSCGAKYRAVDQLQKSGQLKDLPYPDAQKQKDICVQWSTWTDPEICKLSGSTPATKEDLRKVVYKQVGEDRPMTPATKKKVDQGIDTIFAKVELTTAKAKDLEKAAGGDGANPPPSTGPINVSDDTGKPGETPKTTEKEKEKEKAPAPPGPPAGKPEISEDGKTVTTKDKDGHIITITEYKDKTRTQPNTITTYNAYHPNGKPAEKTIDFYDRPDGKLGEKEIYTYGPDGEPKTKVVKNPKGQIKKRYKWVKGPAVGEWEEVKDAKPEAPTTEDKPEAVPAKW